jgi:hypothetical protein
MAKLRKAIATNSVMFSWQKGKIYPKSSSFFGKIDAYFVENKYLFI